MTGSIIEGKPPPTHKIFFSEHTGVRTNRVPYSPQCSGSQLITSKCPWGPIPLPTPAPGGGISHQRRK